MDVDEDDDFYAPEENVQESSEQERKVEDAPEPAAQADEDEDLEEGEEEDEAEDGSDSDIDIITERKDGIKPAPPSQPRYNDIRNIPQRTGASDVVTKPSAPKKETLKATQQVSGKDLPGISTSKINVDAKPIYVPAGKPITQVNIDEDLAESDKPWRRPGTDVSDYFNYGFDEFTWALYASKQESLRSEYNAEKIAQNNKKMFEDMNMLMSMGAIPGMAGAGMPGMEGMPVEMQAMMQQFIAQGGDPSQMDPSAMFAGMQGSQGGGAGGATGAAQGQGFGGQGGFGQGQNFGYEGNNRAGGNFGRGRGGNRRGQW